METTRNVNASAERTQRFRLVGMDCASCATTLQKGVAQLDGVVVCAVSYANETMRVTGDAAPEDVVARVRALGYDVATDLAAGDDPDATQLLPPASRRRQSLVEFMMSRLETRLALVGLVLILPGLLFSELLRPLGLEHPLLDVSSVLAMVVAGGPIARSAWRALRVSRDVNIDVLMTVASLGAVGIGAYTEAGLVMVLFAIGEALESFTAQRARESIRSLMEVAPLEATRLRPCQDCREHLGVDGYAGGPCPHCPPTEEVVPVADLKPGDAIVVKPGRRIPMDGRVISGRSAVNQAPITGESLPVERAVGDDVFAGTINGAGALTVAVTRLAADNTISRIIQMVEEAQERRAPAQRFVDRFARIYTPAVIALAALVAVLPPLLFGEPWVSAEAPTDGWLYRALALLVVACPCALVISTPVSLISALGNAARHGVLVKGGAYLEALARIRAVALDKTGTLTAGVPDVRAVRAVACQGEEPDRCEPCLDLLALAAAVERRSEHPLARAVVEASAAQGLSSRYTADDVAALVGTGVKGTVAGEQVLVGSHAHFDGRIPHPPAHHEEMKAAAAKGLTPLLVGRDDRYLGYIAVADPLRDTSREAIAALRRAGIERVIMLTGDDAGTARRIADEAGITDVRAGLMPGDKVKALEALQAEVGSVAMVGDGINDAPALATADVGIAMGAAGSSQAMETADIALLSDDLNGLPFAVRLSRATMANIRFNIALSLGLKGAFLLLVLAGAGTLWMAVFADMGASLLVTLNGMRLRSQPRP